LTTVTANRAATPFERIGGTEILRRIVDRFYDLMDSDPDYADLRAMHATDLGPMRDSLTGFLTGWTTCGKGIHVPRYKATKNISRCYGSIGQEHRYRPL